MDHYFTNNENLKSEIKTVNYSYNEHEYSFLTDNGVFSKSKIDYGSKLLLETFLKNYTLPGTILDVGCGYGFIGLTLAIETGNEVVMIDINKRALHLCKRNAEKFKLKPKIIESDMYENVNDKFDYIITNPPVRVGKSNLLKILVDAKNYLKDSGQLWYVLRKDQGAKSVLKLLNEHYKIENVKKSNGFYIFKAIKY